MTAPISERVLYGAQHPGTDDGPGADSGPERANTAEAEPLTYATYADVDDTPPPPLVLDMLEPQSETILYGSGGIGKGATTAYLTKRAQEEGRRVMVYDAEQRPREWSRRFSALGVDRSEVVRVEPKYHLPPKLFGKPLYDIVPYLGRVAQDAGCEILFIDSILAAMGVGEEKLKSDGQAPYLVARALSDTGLTSVCIAHPPRATPEGDPYGSVAWVNAFRLTWLGVKVEGRSHRVRWRPRKRNERGHLPAMLFSFNWSESGLLTGVMIEDDEIASRNWIRQALAHGGRTVEDMAEERMADADEYSPAVSDRIKAGLRQTLSRMKRDGEVEKEGRRGGVWKIRRR